MTPKIKTSIEMTQEEFEIAQKLRKMGITYIEMFRLGLSVMKHEHLSEL